MCAQIRRAAGEGVRSRGVGDAKMAHTEQSPLLLNLVLGVRAVIVRKKVFLYTRHEDMAELEAFGAVDRAQLHCRALCRRAGARSLPIETVDVGDQGYLIQKVAELIHAAFPSEIGQLAEVAPAACFLIAAPVEHVLIARFVEKQSHQRRQPTVFRVGLCHIHPIVVVVVVVVIVGRLS